MEPKDLHSPGGKVKTKVEDGTVSTAVFSEDGLFRYRLVRRWERVGPLVLFIMQNPSTADEKHNDPTVAKCCRLAKKWGYSGVMIGNVSAYRSTDNRRLRSEFFTEENFIHLVKMCTFAEKIIVAHGKLPRRLQDLAKGVIQSLQGVGFKLHALKLCKDGTPGHPLFLSEDLLPIDYVINAPETSQDLSNKVSSRHTAMLPYRAPCSSSN